MPAGCNINGVTGPLPYFNTNTGKSGKVPGNPVIYRLMYD